MAGHCSLCCQSMPWSSNLVINMPPRNPIYRHCFALYTTQSDLGTKQELGKTASINSILFAQNSVCSAFRCQCEAQTNYNISLFFFLSSTISFPSKYVELHIYSSKPCNENVLSIWRTNFLGWKELELSTGNQIMLVEVVIADILIFSMMDLPNWSQNISKK